LLHEVGWDRRMSGLGVLANLYWIRGFPETAARLGATAIDEARRIGYVAPISVAMTWQGFNKYLTEIEIDDVEGDLVEFVEHARRHRIVADQGLALSLLGLCQARRGQYEAAAGLVTEGLRLMTDGHYEVFSPIVRAHLCEAALTAGQNRAAIGIMAELEA